MRIKAWLGARPVIAFVILAYVISWSFWLPLLAARQGWVNWSASTYLHLWGGLGPAAAALIVTGVVDGRAGIAGLVRAIRAVHGRLGWLALAVLYPLTVFAAAVVVARVVEGDWPDLTRFGASVEYPMLPLAAYWLANLAFYGYGEEIGWRGLAQPRLQRRHSALTAAVLVSLIWACWHLPLFGITATYRSMPAIGFLGFYSACSPHPSCSPGSICAAEAASSWSRSSTPPSTLLRPRPRRRPSSPS
jgi:uncharacterized protein